MLLKNGQRENNLPKLKKQVVFELTDKYSHYDKKNKKMIRTNRLTEPASYLKYDEKSNDNVEIRYAETETPFTDATGKLGKKYYPPKITFAKGLLIVKPTQPDLYEFMINNPELESNGGKKFRLKDPIVAATKSVATKQLLFKAQQLILGDKNVALSEKDQRRILLASGHPDVSEMDIELVKETLLKIAEADPIKFIQTCSSKQTDAKGAVVLAHKAGFLACDTDKQIWKWGANSGADGNIVTVPRGQSIGDWFTDWLLNTDNSGVLAQINLLLDGKATKKEQALGAPKAKA